jgi:hypothetical protein
MGMNPGMSIQEARTSLLRFDLTFCMRKAAWIFRTLEVREWHERG